jgi:hypothetical protein
MGLFAPTVFSEPLKVVHIRCSSSRGEFELTPIYIGDTASSKQRAAKGVKWETLSRAKPLVHGSSAFHVGEGSIRLSDDPKRACASLSVR